MYATCVLNTDLMPATPTREFLSGLWQERNVTADQHLHTHKQTSHLEGLSRGPQVQLLFMLKLTHTCSQVYTHNSAERVYVHLCWTRACIGTISKQSKALKRNAVSTKLDCLNCLRASLFLPVCAVGEPSMFSSPLCWSSEEVGRESCSSQAVYLAWHLNRYCTLFAQLTRTMSSQRHSCANVLEALYSIHRPCTFNNFCCRAERTGFVHLFDHLTPQSQSWNFSVRFESHASSLLQWQQQGREKKSSADKLPQWCQLLKRKWSHQHCVAEQNSNNLSALHMNFPQSRLIFLSCKLSLMLTLKLFLSLTFTLFFNPDFLLTFWLNYIYKCF